MNILIAIKSCYQARHSGSHVEIRDTWSRNFEGNLADIRFFEGDVGQQIGIGIASMDFDEIFLYGCPDDYLSLPFKTQRILRWAEDKNYDYIFLCDNDTFVKPELLKSGFEKYDYIGCFNGLETFNCTDINGNHYLLPKTFEYTDEYGNYFPLTYSWASGGWGYFLSKKAARLVASNTPTGWAEDFWVGQVLGPLVHRRNITCKNIPKNTVTFHKAIPV